MARDLCVHHSAKLACRGGLTSFRITNFVCSQTFTPLNLHAVLDYCVPALQRTTVPPACPTDCAAPPKIWSGCKASTRSSRRKHMAKEEKAQARHRARPHHPPTKQVKRLGAFRARPPGASTTAPVLSGPVTGTPDVLTSTTSRRGGGLHRIFTGAARNTEKKSGTRMKSR